MNALFLIHSPFLLDEYPFCDRGMWKHKTRTAERTAALRQLLEGAGEVERINLTMWCVRTTCSPSALFDIVRAGWQRFGGIEKVGDMFVIQAQAIAAHGSVEGMTAMGKLLPECGMAKEDDDIPLSKERHVPETRPTPEPTVIDQRKYLDRMCEDYDLKPTDAMLRRLPGCYGMGKKR